MSPLDVRWPRAPRNMLDACLLVVTWRSREQSTHGGYEPGFVTTRAGCKGPATQPPAGGGAEAWADETEPSARGGERARSPGRALAAGRARLQGNDAGGDRAHAGN